MTLKAAVAFITVLVLSASAETFRLKDSATHKTYGPFQFRHGGQINVAEQEWELVRIDPRHNEIIAAAQKQLIQSLDFRDAQLADVVLFLTETGRRTGSNVDMVVTADVKQTPTVTISIRQLSLHETLSYICEMTGTRCAIRHGVIILEAAEAPLVPTKLDQPDIKSQCDLIQLQSKTGSKTSEPVEFSNGNRFLLDGMLLSLTIDPKNANTIAFMKNLVIPSMDFRGASAKDVSRFLTETIKRQSKEPAPLPRVVSESTNETPKDNITCSIRKKSLYDTIGIICEASGLHWNVQDGNIVLVD